MHACVTARQCKRCPWLVTTDPRTIPGGYCEAKHRALTSTIARPGLPDLSAPLRMMACHESSVGRERPCVGWLHQQLTVGNNIALRLAVVRGRITSDYELVGKQHASLEDTFPSAPARAYSSSASS